MIGEQYDLFAGAPPSVKGSDTSEKAAESMRESVGHLQRTVFNHIKASRDGMTCDEAEELTGLRHQTCSARVRELVLKGFIVDSGNRRKTRSGRGARVYVATGKEMPA